MARRPSILQRCVSNLNTKLLTFTSDVWHWTTIGYGIYAVRTSRCVFSSLPPPSIPASYPLLLPLSFSLSLSLFLSLLSLISIPTWTSCGYIFLVFSLLLFASPDSSYHSNSNNKARKRKGNSAGSIAGVAADRFHHRRPYFDGIVSASEFIVLRIYAYIFLITTRKHCVGYSSSLPNSTFDRSESDVSYWFDFHLRSLYFVSCFFLFLFFFLFLSLSLSLSLSLFLSLSFLIEKSKISSQAGFGS